MTSEYSFISRLLLLVLCFCWGFSYLLPYHFSPWKVFYNDILIFFALVVGGFFCAFQGGKFDWNWSVTALILLLITLVPIAQYLSGMIVFYGDALVASFYLLSTSVAFSIGFSLRGSLKLDAMLLIAWVFLIVGFISAVIGILQWLRLEGYAPALISPVNFSSGRVYANINQANNYATLIVLGIVAAFYLSHKRYQAGLAFGLCIMVMVFGCSLGQSKTSWLSLTFVCLSGIFYQYKYRVPLRSSWLALTLVLFLLSIFLLPWLSESLQFSSNSIARRMETNPLRFSVWVGLSEAIIQQPMLGYGWQQVSLAQLAVAADTAPMIYVEHSHNLLQDLILWNGCIIGGAIILFFSFKLFRILLKINSTESWFLLSLLSPILIHGMLEFPLEYAYFLLPFAWVFGMASSNIETGPILRIRRELLLLVSVFFCLILVISVKEYLFQEEKNRTIRAAARGIDVSHVKLNPPVFLMFNQLSGFMDFAGTQARPNMTVQELDWMGKVAHRFAYAPSLFRYTLALSINQQPEHAVKELKKIKTLYSESIYAEACKNLTTMADTYPEIKEIPFGCP